MLDENQSNPSQTQLQQWQWSRVQILLDDDDVQVA